SGGALVGYALQGDSREGVWLEPTEAGDRLYQAVAVPFRPGAGSPIAVMVAALPVDSALMEILRRNTSSEVLVFSRDTAGLARPLVGRVPEGVDLTAALGTDTTVSR